MHLLEVPFAFVELPIWPLIRALAVDPVFKEVSRVLRAVGPSKEALAHLLASLVLPFELGSIWPNLDTKPILLVLYPVAFVG